MGLRDSFVKIGVLKPGASNSPVPEEKMHDLKPTAKGSAKVSSKASTNDTDPPIGSDADEFYKTLEKALRKSAGDGFDYLKFKDTLKKMASHVPEEAARYAAAGASAESMKMSADDLISSAQDYIAVLDKQEALFKDAQSDIQTEVDKDEADLKTINKQIADLESQKAVLEAEIADNTKKINEDKASFDAGYDKLASEIKQDISKIKKYLKN